MYATLSTSELLKLINRAEEAYSKSPSAIAQRMRVAAMRKMVEDFRKISPQKSITITLEDHVLLADLP